MQIYAILIHSIIKNLGLNLKKLSTIHQIIGYQFFSSKSVIDFVI